MNRFIKIAWSLFFMFGANLVFAQYATLAPDTSTVSFVTTKVQDIQEVMWFEKLSGSISDNGEVKLSIDPASINTAVEIRDDRMKEHLFMVGTYPNIEISAEIDTDSLKNSQKLTLPATLALLGVEYQIELKLMVTVSDHQIAVASAEPVLLNAKTLGLGEGVATLGELAGGIWIANSVPVSFALTFDLAE